MYVILARCGILLKRMIILIVNAQREKIIKTSFKNFEKMQFKFGVSYSNGLPAGKGELS